MGTRCRRSSEHVRGQARWSVGHPRPSRSAANTLPREPWEQQEQDRQGTSRPATTASVSTAAAGSFRPVQPDHAAAPDRHPGRGATHRQGSPHGAAWFPGEGNNGPNLSATLADSGRRRAGWRPGGPLAAHGGSPTVGALQLRGCGARGVPRLTLAASFAVRARPAGEADILEPPGTRAPKELP